MEEQLVSRARADDGVIAAAGTVDGRPAVDWIERRSDDLAAFPAATLQVISAGTIYDQDGAGGLQIRRVRVECFGADYLGAKTLSRAFVTMLEQPATVSGVRFHRSKIVLERDFPPEDLGSGLKVFRVLQDFMIPTTA